MKAKDVMSGNVVSVGPGHGVSHAARIMLENHVSGLPVLADDQKLVGMLTEGDLMRRAELKAPSLLLSGGDAEGNGDVTARDYIKSHSWQVSDVMSRQVVTLNEETPLGRIAEIMTKHDIKRVPVMRGDTMVGIVSRADLLRGIVTGASDQTASGDEAIRRAVETRLQADLGFFTTETGVTVSNGLVVLWGRVETEAQCEAARIAAESVRCVDGVTNNSRVMKTDDQSRTDGPKRTAG